MNPSDELRVVAMPGSLNKRSGWFGPADPLAEAWLPVVGPACFVLWQKLAQHLLANGGAMATSLREMARAAGLAETSGHQSGIMRTLRRLERFGVIWRPDERVLVVRCRLPALDQARLERLRPTIEELRDGLREAAVKQGPQTDWTTGDPPAIE